MSPETWPKRFGNYKKEVPGWRERQGEAKFVEFAVNTAAEPRRPRSSYNVILTTLTTTPPPPGGIHIPLFKLNEFEART